MRRLYLKQLLLLLGDVALLYATLTLALTFRRFSLPSWDVWQAHAILFTAIYAVWLVSFYSVGLYDLAKIWPQRSLAATFINTLAFNTLVAAAFFYFAKGRFTLLSPQTILLLNVALFGIAWYAWRVVFSRLIAAQAFLRPLAYVGSIPSSLEMFDTIRANPQLGYRLALIGSFHTRSVAPDDHDVLRITNPAGLVPAILRHNIKTVVMHFPDDTHHAFREALYQALAQRFVFIDSTAFSEMVTGKVHVSAIGQAWFLHNLTEGSKRLYELFKRAFDIAGSFVLAVISLPFIPLILLAIKTTSPGPAFFTQWRIGQNGRKFLAMKFRTMYIDAERHGPQWAQKNDPRATRVGRFLRKMRVDEIPQLINILRGEMSFVGPRPERVEFVQELTKDIPYYQERHLVKPGLTGWAQINFPYGASKTDALEKLQYDLYYIKNRSLILDLTILLKTIKVVMQGSGQ